MTIKQQDHASREELTDELLRQRASSTRSHQRRVELENRIDGFEKRYGIKSEFIHMAIDRGELTETQEVCRWIMDYDILKRAQTR